MISTKYSVLMSVYYKETPNNLRTSIESMLNQSIKPDEIVIIKDGPLTIELNNILQEYQVNQNIKLIELKENVGLGRALRLGVEACSNQYIARMDTDDIAVLDRCEKQLRFLLENPDISVVGSFVAEFIEDPLEITSYRIVPVENQDIKQKIKYKNPINHPTVMFKKDDILLVGNYEDYQYCEDYFLWIKMIERGMKFHNMEEYLVKMRVSQETYLRRSGKKLFFSQKKLFDYMLDKKIINIFQYTYNLMIRFIVQLVIPNKLRRKIYNTLLRKENK